MIKGSGPCVTDQHSTFYWFLNLEEWLSSPKLKLGCLKVHWCHEGIQRHMEAASLLLGDTNWVSSLLKENGSTPGCLEVRKLIFDRSQALSGDLVPHSYSSPLGIEKSHGDPS